MKIFICIFFILSLMSCAAEKESNNNNKGNLEIPKQKYDFDLVSFDVSNETKILCDSGIKKFSQGHFSSTQNELKKIFNNLNKEKKETCADNIADNFLLNLNNNNIKKTNRLSLEDVDFETLVVGAGLHSSIIARNTYKKVLIIDEEEKPANHFHSYAFRLNSPSYPYDINYFPNNAISILKHAEIGKNGQNIYPKSRQIWNQIIFNLFNSNILLLTKTKIDKIKKHKDLFIVNLKKDNETITILVKNIILTTGLGEEILPKTDNNEWLNNQRTFLKNSDQKNLSSLPSVMTYEELFSLSYEMAKNGKSIFDFLKNKDIGVVGAGDSGKVAVEFLTGYAPQEAYFVEGVNSFEPIKSILWFGQKYDSFEEFSQPSSNTKKRYIYDGFKNIFQGVSYNKGNFKFENYHEHVEKINFNNNKVEVVSLKNKKEVDILIVAIGYENNNEQFMKNTFLNLKDKDFSFNYIKKEVPAKRHFDTTIENIAEQLCLTNNDCFNIYALATAVKNIQITNQRIKKSITKNTHSIEILSVLTETFTKLFLN